MKQDSQEKAMAWTWTINELSRKVVLQPSRICAWYRPEPTEVFPETPTVA